jgi:IMP dehydrogenase/GMP reductase
MKMKLDWKDITIVPSKLSEINSRSEIDCKRNNKLPIFAAPMDTVIDKNSSKFFFKKINVCLPRDIEDVNMFQSLSLDSAEYLFNNGKLPNKTLIDIANGNMIRIYNLSKTIKDSLGDKIELMIGNIANPETFEEYCKLGVDYVRCGIGGGSACLTAQNVGVFYPMASLILECSEISNKYGRKTKIIADGGFREYSDIIKALALGSDYVMIGGILSKCLESCSRSFIKKDDFIEVSEKDAMTFFKEGGEIYKKYRGMSTKEVQKDWGKSVIKTSEGITKYNLVEYTFESWVENFEDYLKSCMSYTNSKNLDEFIGKVKFVEISENSYKRFEK